MHILMNLNVFMQLSCKFVQRHFAQKIVKFFLVLLENNNMRILLLFPLRT
jgi:uncharacterized protein (UPF0305 family)